MRLKSPSYRPSLLYLVFGALLAAGAGLSGCQGEETTGPNSNAKITLTHPLGGESFKVGDTVWIRWTVKDDPNPVEAVDPMFSPDNGMSWKTLSQSIGPTYRTWGNFGWKIPDSLFIITTWFQLAGTTQGLIRVKDYTTDDPLNQSTLTKTFSITAPAP